MQLTALPLALLLACPGEGPGFGPGGEPGPDDEWVGSTDTAPPPLDDGDLLGCMARGDVDAHSGGSPPALQGRYAVSGTLVASDSDHPPGSPTSGQLCITGQGEGLAVSESAFGSSTQSSWAQLTGQDQRFTLWLALEGDDPHDPDCVVSSLAVVSGTTDGEDLEIRTATVPVAYDDCEAYDPETLGSCWATRATATKTGGCDG
jgi:hypothetical protein